MRLQRVLSRVTRGYRGIPIFTGGRTGLQEVIGVYNGLQGVCKTPTSGICLPGVGQFAEVPCRRVAVYTKEVSRYHRDIKNIPSNVRVQVKRSNQA